MKIWIARDRDGLTLFSDKPEIVHTRMSLPDGLFMSDGNWVPLPLTIFPELTYENSPWEFELITVVKDDQP